MSDPDDRPEPIYVRHEPCKNHANANPYVDNDGRCADCRQKVPHDRLGPKKPNSYTRVAHDHERPVRAYVVEDMVSCSCGGWHGTPVGRDRGDATGRSALPRPPLTTERRRPACIVTHCTTRVGWGTVPEHRQRKP